MKRSVGVTIIAILCLLGSLATFGMGIAMLAVMILAPVSSSGQFPGSPIFFKVILLIVSLMYLLPAVWGILTCIGLWKLKNWARISMIVFSVLLILMGGFAGLMSLIVPIPAAPNSSMDPSVMAGVRILMGVFWLTQLGIGIWWLVFFNRPKVKQQFMQPIPVLASGPTLQTIQPVQGTPIGTSQESAVKSPLSIKILAWFLLAGCLFIPLSFVLHTPAILFTKLLTGKPAVLFSFTLAAAQLCIGVGLLRLKPVARTAAIIYFVFAFLNSAVFYLTPGGHARVQLLMNSQESMFPWMRQFQSQPQFQFDSTPFLFIGAIFGLVVITIPLYFLITRRVAFENAAAARRPGRVRLE